MLIISQQIDVVRKLVEAKQLLQAIEPTRHVPNSISQYSHEQLLDLLAKQLNKQCAKSSTDFDLLTYKHHNQLCGCLGPGKGETFCPCYFSSLVDRYKEELALNYLLDKQEIKNV